MHFTMAPGRLWRKWQDGQYSVYTCHMRTIWILVFDGVADGPFGISLDVLGAAQRIARMGLIERAAPLRLEPHVVSVDGGPVRTAAGRRLAVDGGVARRRWRRGDVLLLPGLGMATEPEIELCLRRAQVQRGAQVVARAARAGALVAASCSATFLLGAAGALDGREATTTWWLGPAFARRFPRVTLREDQMVVSSGNLITAGSALAHADLMLAVLARITSVSLAHTVARYLVIDARPSQARYLVREHLRSADPALSRLERFVLANLARQLTVAELARAASTSARTLARRLKQALHVTPREFVRRLRVERAVHLLETTSTPVEQLAAQLGYADPAAFRRLIRRETGETPRRLRAS